MKKVTKVSRDKVKSFDFAKKPHTPGFLFPVAREIISKPVLKGRNFKLKKTNMESVNGPYLMLVTHSSMIDFFVMTVAVQPYRANNVMTLEGFNTYTEPLMRSLGVCGTRKYITDLELKLDQIEMAIGKIKTSVAVDSDDKIAFAKKVLANNNSKTENVFKNFDFAQYGKEGIPLKYPRLDFISNLEKILENLGPKEKVDVLNHFGIIPGHDGYEGLLNNESFETENFSEEAKIAAQKESKKKVLDLMI